jgi:hypothetical protein
MGTRRANAADGPFSAACQASQGRPDIRVPQQALAYQDRVHARRGKARHLCARSASLTKTILAGTWADRTSCPARPKVRGPGC